MPPDGGPTDAESRGGGNPVTLCLICQRGWPVDTATGNFWHTFDDLAIPGRGPALDFSRTYNSQAAGISSPLGPGWTDSYNMSVITTTDEYQIYQENGSVAPFPRDGGHYRRVLAELTRQPDQSFIFTRTQGLDRFFFNGNGKLTRIADRNNYTTTLTYSATSGLLTNVTDPVGRVLTFTYTLTSSQPFLTEVRDPTNRTVSFGYDSAGNLQTATDVAGEHTGFTYDAAHHLQTATTPRGGLISNDYDGQGRVLTQTLPLTRTLQFAYRTCGTSCTASTVTDTLGYATVYTYSLNRLAALVANPGPRQEVWTYLYSTDYPTGVSQVTDPNSNQWHYIWDGNGNLLTATDPLTRTTRYAYSALNDLLVITNPVSIPITFTRDMTGNLLTVARPLTQTSQILTTTFGYDPLHAGDVLTITNPLSNAWHLAYDSYGYVLTSTNPLTEAIRLDHDSLGRLLTLTSPMGYTATFGYNGYGAPTRATNALGYTTVYTYDGDRNLQNATDPNGHTITYTYNLNDELTRLTHPDNTHSDYEYDGDGRLITQTNALSQSTRYDYDALGRVLTVTSPLTVTAVYSYDLAGNLRVITDADGLLTTLDYDAADQLTGISYDSAGPSTPDVSFSYDDRGLRTAMTDGTGTTNYTYDSLDRLKQVEQGTGETVRYGYDVGSRLTELGYPDPVSGIVTATRAYNAADQLTGLSDWLKHNFQFTYDADGRLSEMTYPNGVEAAYNHDRIGQVRSIYYTLTSTLIFSAAYTPDPVGLLLASSEDGTSTIGHDYEYDARNRVRGDQESVGSIYTNTWTLDDATEIVGTSRTIGGATGTTTSRTYNAGNQLLGLHIDNGIIGFGDDRSFTYSTTGNRLTGQTMDGSSYSMSYDQANRLVDYNGDAQYSYNGDGLRLTKSARSGSEDFVWDVGAGLPLLLADGTARYLYGPGGQVLEQVDGSGDAYYYHADRLGSIRALTNASGTVQNSYSYDAYGNVTASSGGTYNPFGYAGEYTDAETGFLYLRARYYDPATQQFLTMDPLLAATEQAYNYAGGDPVNGTDPAGLRLVEEDLHGGGGGSDAPDPIGMGMASIPVMGGMRFGNGPPINAAQAIRSYQAYQANRASAKGGSSGSGGAGPVTSGGGSQPCPQILVPRSKYPQSAQHIEDAQAAGLPRILTIDRPGTDARRAAATNGFPRVPGQQPDEYPPAMFKEGGAGADVRNINARDNGGSGACIGNQCRPYPNGTKVEIVVVP